jgi:hypothetical protein
MGTPIPTVLAAMACAAFAAGCAGRSPTVKIPASDPTPPLTALDVVGHEGRLMLFSGDGPKTVDIGPGDSVVLIALGEDRDGGVKDLSLVGNAIAHCGDSARGVPLERKSTPSLKSGSFARRSVLPARPGWRVPGSKSTRYVLKADDFRKLCGPLELKGVTGAAGVRAVNYHGKSSMSPTLEFRIAAPTQRTSQAQASQASQAKPQVFGPIPLSEMPDTPRI